MWFVYIILCADGSLYTGTSNNPSKRFQKHLKGTAARYTKSHKPVKQVFLQAVGSRSQALKREHQIKSWPRSKKINSLKLKVA